MNKWSEAKAVLESAVAAHRDGNGRAREWIARAFHVARPGIALGNAAEALANVGDVQRAGEIRREQSALGPLGGWLEPGVMVTEATLQLQQGKALSALETLRRTLPMDLGRYTAFRPPYVRGLTYLALGDGTAAAAEFQKIVDHRGIAPLSVLYALAFLQQGRAYVLAGELSR